MLNPERLLAVGQVDVIAGKIHRRIDGADVWEYEPALIAEYGRLRRYVEAVVARDAALRELIHRCG